MCYYSFSERSNMPDHLAEWISNKPHIIEEIKEKPLLERMLRRIQPPQEHTVSEEQWNQIVESLKQ